MSEWCKPWSKVLSRKKYLCFMYMYVSCEKDEEVHETHLGICYIYIYVYNLSEIGIEE